MSEDKKFSPKKQAILDALTGEKELKENAQKGQNLLYSSIFSLFKGYPDKYFTAKTITDRFGLFKGHTEGRGGNHWFCQGVLVKLEQDNKIVGGEGKGYKLNV